MSSDLALNFGSRHLKFDTKEEHFWNAVDEIVTLRDPHLSFYLQDSNSGSNSSHNVGVFFHDLQDLFKATLRMKVGHFSVCNNL